MNDVLYGYCCLLKTLLQRETAHHTSIDHQYLEDTWIVYYRDIVNIAMWRLERSISNKH